MSGGSVVTAIDLNSTVFQKTFAKLDEKVKRDAKKIMSELMLLDLARPPAKLHLHTLTSKTVRSALDPKKSVNVYAIHISSDDKFKASFTFENGTAYFRVCGEHDWVDKNPA